MSDTEKKVLNMKKKVLIALFVIVLLIDWIYWARARNNTQLLDEVPRFIQGEWKLIAGRSGDNYEIRRIYLSSTSISLFLMSDDRKETRDYSVWEVLLESDEDYEAGEMIIFYGGKRMQILFDKWNLIHVDEMFRTSSGPDEYVSQGDFVRHEDTN